MACLTKKRRLGASLAQAYGNRDAWSLVSPLTFELPLQLSAWREYLDGEGEEDEEERQGVIEEQGEGREERQETEQQRQRERKRNRRRGELWILKTAEHLGKGLALLPAEQAYEVAAAQQRQMARRAAAARQRAAATQQQQQQGAAGSNGARPPVASSSSSAPAIPLPSTNQRSFLLAQRYVSDPLLLPSSLPGGVGGRKFGLRLWMVVTGVDPIRAYAFKRGLVLFSDAPYSSAAAAAAAGDGNDDDKRAVAAAIAAAAANGDGDDDDKRVVAAAMAAATAAPASAARPPPPPRAHVTNYAANVDGDVWELAELERALGADAFSRVWRGCLRSCALAAAAACADLRAEHQRLCPPPESGFELVGLDFVVDSALRPWLLEVNSTPSLSAEHSDPATRRTIRETKSALVEGLANLLGAPSRFDARYAPLRAWVAAKTRTAKGGGSAARTAELERKAARLEPAAAAASRALVESGGGGGGERAGDGGDGAARAEQRAASVAAALDELDRAEQAGDFEPLFDLFPYDEVFERGWDVPFSRADYELRQRRSSTATVADGNGGAAPSAAAAAAAL
jgi:hypothetical protein